MILKSHKTPYHIIIAMVMVFINVFGCSDDKDEIVSQSGYVQFKLYKEQSYKDENNPETRSNRLDLLSDAKKIRVVMQYKGSTIEQTLVLNSYNDSNAEFGLRSDHLELLSGDYSIIGFYLYNKLDEEIVSGATVENSSFVVEQGGLTVKDLTVEAKSRGMLSFKLIKDFVKTRSDDNTSYPFDKIQMVDISVKNLFSQKETTFEKIKVEYRTDFKDKSADESLYPDKNAQTAFSICDTVVWLNAGKYRITGYTTYSDKKGENMLETRNLSSAPTFTVTDNKETKLVEVPIQLKESAEYIKDYIALKEIWEALDGENWRYYGEEIPMGTNWNFNRDIDMWGMQPGVGLDSNGRITFLDISGFGASGVVPDAIGQLTELKVLSFGNHNEMTGGHMLDKQNPQTSDEQLKKTRYHYYKKVLSKDGREGLSDILKDAINRDASQENITKSEISLKDVQHGNISNNITGFSRAMMRLTNLQQLFIANSPITFKSFFRDIKPESPFYAERHELSWSNLNKLVDFELYNCPSLSALPLEILIELPELQSLNIASNKGISGQQLKSDWEGIIDGASGDKIQLLYMGFNNLKEFPRHEHLKKMVKLGLLDCSYNQIEKIHPFGRNVALVQFFINNNKITEIPKADDGYFFNFNDVENFTCANNQLTTFPDIFNAESIYVMLSVDFSANKIDKFENGDNFKGVNANSVNLSDNKFTTFPSELFKSGSPIGVLMLAGNGMEEIPEGSMTGENSYMLTSLDLTYNNLTDLPNDFLANNIPYLYGIDISYNSFSHFPFEPLNVSSLNVYGIRHQRDSNGNRTLRDWPTGIYQHASLRALFLGSNDLRKIDDTISPNINILEIKDNPNISIDVSDVCPYITAGYFLLIYDKTQDIRGCSALGIEN